MEELFPEVKKEEILEVEKQEKDDSSILIEEKTIIAENDAENENIEIVEKVIIENPKKEETVEERNLRRWEKYTNRIKESFAQCSSNNIQNTAIELFRSYLNWTWAFFARECYSTCCGTFEDSQVAASVLAIINSKLFDVGKKTIMYTLYRFKLGFERSSNRDIEKAAIFIGECYRQRMVSSPLMIQIFYVLFQEKRKFMQTIIKLFWNVIPVINDDDENAMKILFDNLYKYQSDAQFSSQIERIYNWRQNNWTNVVKGTSKLYARIPRRFDMIEEEDQITHDTIDLDEIQTERDPISDFVVPWGLENADQMHDDYKGFLEATLADDEEEEEEDKNDLATNSNIPIDLTDSKLTEESIKTAQQKNNELQIKRRIYLTLVSNATANATAHNIVKLEDKYEGKYNRVIVTTVVEYVGMEKTFNRDLAVIVQMLCRVKPENKMITEELFKINYDQTYSYTIHRITNIACLYSYLLANDEISWSILQAILLTEEDTNSAQRVFIRILVEELAKNMSYDGFLRRLKLPEVEQWTSGIFPTDTIEHAEFASAYFTEIKLERICERLNKRIAEMEEEIQRQREEELRLLQPTPQMAWRAPDQNTNEDLKSNTYDLAIDEENKGNEKESSHRHKHKHKHRHSHRHNDDDDDDGNNEVATGYPRHKYYEDFDDDVE